MQLFTHPSVRAVAVLAIILAAANLVAPLPWWVWAAAGALAVAAFVQAFRARDDQ